MRGLAEQADVSAAQISRLERGLVELPSIDTLAAIAKALDRNPIPLWIVAGHVGLEDSIRLLRDMLPDDSEIFDEWGDEGRKLDALAFLGRSDPDPEAIRRLAAEVFQTFETEETLWETFAHRSGGASTVEEVRLVDHLKSSLESSALLEIVRHLPKGRIAKVREYALDQFQAEFGREFIGSIDPMADGEEIVPMAIATASEVKPFTRGWLEHRGFTGFVSVQALRGSGAAQIPATGGIYVMLATGHPGEFLEVSAGGHFKHKDPTVSMATLSGKWVESCDCVYIGKGGNLRRRIKQFVDYGDGKPVGHWGGRYVWQLADSERLLVAWKETEGIEPRLAEIELMEEFRAAFGALPFANLVT